MAAAKAVSMGATDGIVNNGIPNADVEAIVRSLAREALIHVERAGSSQLSFRLLRTVRDLLQEGFTAGELAQTQALHRQWHAGRWRSNPVDLVEDVREHLDDYLEPSGRLWKAGTPARWPT
jgi:hypothetical protein